MAKMDDRPKMQSVRECNAFSTKSLATISFVLTFESDSSGQGSNP